MSAKLDFTSVAPEVGRALVASGALLEKSDLELNLLALVALRASQLNRCAFCLAFHMREGQALGESSDRLSGVVAWREAPWYSMRERLALEWTEALTQLASQQPPSDLLERMKEQYNEREIVYLTLAVATINTFNRFNVAFGTSPAAADAFFNMLHPEAAPAHA